MQHFKAEALVKEEGVYALGGWVALVQTSDREGKEEFEAFENRMGTAGVIRVEQL